MKNIYLILAFAFTNLNGWAQTHTSPQDTIYELGTPEEPATFPGGHDAMNRFIQQNLKWPGPGWCGEGKVYVQFNVDEKGRHSGYVIKRGIDEAANREAIAVVKKMPPWEPGRFAGKPVKCRMVIPVRFKLK